MTQNVSITAVFAKTVAKQEKKRKDDTRGDTIGGFRSVEWRMWRVIVRDNRIPGKRRKSMDGFNEGQKDVGGDGGWNDELPISQPTWAIAAYLKVRRSERPEVLDEHKHRLVVSRRDPQRGSLGCPFLVA